ncbi:MAG: tetratricopeptide repeat protein [Elusimicrobia bacterium]|nr:tetratricopeptide repeat protein [Candidatus Liberimonas magnetica]
MKKTILILSLSLSLSLPLFATDDSLNLFNQANGFYEKGEFVKAINLYEQLVSKNQANGSLFYNLGNAYYKNQQMGFAVLNYEKALKLMPRDNDVRYNIDFINRMLKEPPPSFIDQVMQALNNLASLNELLSLSSFLFLLFIFIISVFIFNKQRALLLTGGIVLLLLLVAACLLFIKIDREVMAGWAIVTSGPAEVRNGPGLENSIGFSLPEGKKIMTLGQKDEWVAIGLKQEGLRGWLEKKYINEI